MKEFCNYQQQTPKAIEVRPLVPRFEQTVLPVAPPIMGGVIIPREAMHHGSCTRGILDQRLEETPPITDKTQQKGARSQEEAVLLVEGLEVRGDPPNTKTAY